mgnify:CR=1 FL=1
MVVQIAIKNFWDESRTWKNDIVLWSMDQAEQEATKQRFICWKAIEHMTISIVQFRVLLFRYYVI